MNSGLDPLEANMAFAEEFLDNAEGVAFDLDDDENGWYTSPPEFAFAGSMDDEPASYHEAMNGSDAAQWKAACRVPHGYGKTHGFRVMGSAVTGTVVHLAYPAKPCTRTAV